ncbi:WSC domain-containing protein 2-like [Mytilus californianus]|uniref:WSC domain-containing protein 2-like n=1 Tax=Mytilus californianus TaxID=6549 RepID=UPI0022476620|nr:WSC domain-containing protein 2-like [Mytilus californianus]
MIALLQLCILALVSYYQIVAAVEVTINGRAQFDLAGSEFAEYVDQQIEQLRQFRYEGYIGCFIDKRSRHLRHHKGNFKDMNLEKCRALCTNFEYLGLQNSDQCFCGNKLNDNNYPGVPDTQCSKKCKGESTRMCGAGWRNSIYRVKP